MGGSDFGATHCGAFFGSWNANKTEVKVKGERFWRRSLQCLYGIWNAVKTDVKMYRSTFGTTLCRSSLGVGMLIKQK